MYSRREFPKHAALAPGEELSMLLCQRAAVGLLSCLVCFVAPARGQDIPASERDSMYYRYLEFAELVRGGTVTPHWMADKSSFWYAEGAPDQTVIYKVDPAADAKTPLFDGARLRGVLTDVLGYEPPYAGLPFSSFAFTDQSESAITFTVESGEFLLELDGYTITRVPPKSEAEKSRATPQLVRKGFTAGAPDIMDVPSPDGRWFATEKDDGLWLRSTSDGRAEPLIADGVKGYAWSVAGAKWSPNSYKLAATKIDTRQTDSIPIVHWLKTTEEVEWAPYVKAGGPMPRTELYIVDILSKAAVRVDTGEEDQHLHLVGWVPDGSEFLFLRMNREFKKLDLMVADPTTGRARVVLEETQETFIKGIASNPGWQQLFTLLPDGERFIWISERDGWDHLYLYRLDGTLIRRLTGGEFPVLRVVAVDQEAGWVYFTAHAEQRIYDTHLYRVNLSGEGFARLTEATGQHAIAFSPSKQYFLDTHSTTARPPATELRAAAGRLIRTLSTANIDRLAELQWSPPEEFIVQADDGETDLYGVLYKPYDFDPAFSYPVIDYIYNGPQTTWVPRTFTDGRGVQAQALAQLGFVTFVVDGRGTTERGKAFQDVVYLKFGSHEIPDHVATVKQLAAQRSYLDLDRIGIFGGSWGGYMTVRAMVTAPDIYRVGVATNGVMDHYDHMAYAIEPYMGLPQNNPAAYAASSSHQYAGQLQGKLLLIHATSDVNATFSATMKMVESLIRAGKPYDLLVLPEQNHWPVGASARYWREASRRYFQEHLKPELVTTVSSR